MQNGPYCNTLSINTVHVQYIASVRFAMIEYQSWLDVGFKRYTMQSQKRTCSGINAI